MSSIFSKVLLSFMNGLFLLTFFQLYAFSYFYQLSLQAVILKFHTNFWPSICFLIRILFYFPIEFYLAGKVLALNSFRIQFFIYLVFIYQAVILDLVFIYNGWIWGWISERDIVMIIGLIFIRNLRVFQ